MPEHGAGVVEANRNGGLDLLKTAVSSVIQESARNPLPVSGFFLFPAVEADVLICKLVSFHKEQNPPDQLRDIDRGGDVVVHTLMPVFIFRGKVVVLGEDKERQNRQMSAKCYNGQKILFFRISLL